MITIIIIFSILTFWFGCGFLAYGITLAHFQGYYIDKFFINGNLLDWYEHMFLKEDKITALVIALAGPIGLGVAYFLSGRAKYGLRYK